MLKISLRARSALTVAVLTASTMFLAACAPVQPNLVRVGRADLQLPPGDWERINQGTDELFNVLPDDVSHDLPMRTEAVGLRGAQGQMLAVFVVQTNATNNPRDATLWTQTCPDGKGVQVTDFAKGSPIRVDCLRYRRRADNEEFLTKTRPVFEKWVKQHKVEPLAPYAHVSYRYATAEGGYLLVEALIDQRLLRPKTVGNDQFLAAGKPAQQWLSDFVQAAKNSVAMLDGRFMLPPFPVALPQ